MAHYSTLTDSLCQSFVTHDLERQHHATPLQKDTAVKNQNPSHFDELTPSHFHELTVVASTKSWNVVHRNVLLCLMTLMSLWGYHSSWLVVQHWQLPNSLVSIETIQDGHQTQQFRSFNSVITYTDENLIWLLHLVTNNMFDMFMCVHALLTWIGFSVLFFKNFSPNKMFWTFLLVVKTFFLCGLHFIALIVLIMVIFF